MEWGIYGAPEYQIKKLQRVMNASARLVYRAPKYCHITPLNVIRLNGECFQHLVFNPAKPSLKLAQVEIKV